MEDTEEEVNDQDSEGNAGFWPVIGAKGWAFADGKALTEQLTEYFNTNGAVVCQTHEGHVAALK